MKSSFATKKHLCLLSLLFVVVFSAACGGSVTPVVPTVASTAIPTVQKDLPKIISVDLDRSDVSNYESIEMTITLDAKYTNPYHLREVALEGVFTNPSGQTMTMPGFWDGDGNWKLRFTPSSVGTWNYVIQVKDSRGTSLPNEGLFSVTTSDLHGWIQVGNSYDLTYSGHYLVHNDGTPFYGVGHCDALNILIDGFDIEDGVSLFDDMKKANENFVVWWPLYTNSPVNSSYDEYSFSNMKVIDAIVQDAQKEGIFLVFTIWDHPNLRDDTHAWGDGNWGRNGFSKLGDINSFFVSDEAWAWQENLYRYIIARWGYSPAIGMWQTVSEINGTNSYDQTDTWHQKVNDYFVANDPYHHPTTASGSGEVNWSAGHAVMDMPQLHLYEWNEDAIGAAKTMAKWTSLMWERSEKPNWVGEFGVPGNAYYPELFHHSIWAALASGAAMTPAEWNSGGSWSRLTPEMKADLSRLAEFTKDMPLAKWNPQALQISSSDMVVRGWGVPGNDGGLLWIQDFSAEEKTIEEVRSSINARTNVQIELTGLAEGNYSIQPFDTWQGVFLETFDMNCKANEVCIFIVPNFTSDMAFKIIRK
jgi:hypothetical protein